MAALDNIGHPLSLKVMRVSQPTLASHWQPFFSSSPSFSAHSTSNVMSLQGSEPLPGHPKTLRDLTHAGQMLTLPATFGAIQLGETFSCCLCVNNETVVNVDAVSVKVEMQTVTSKITLAEIGGLDSRLSAKDTLETVVSYEIKELGQHVLSCSVTYRTPPGMRPATSGSENADDPFLQTFRKFYKFSVTNPLSVRTKVQVPRSPSALLSRTDRDKVFLEVHIQNLTQAPLWFEKIRLEAVDGWDVIDANLTDRFEKEELRQGGEKHIFSGSMALMQPADVRQYVYVLNPKTVSSSAIVPVSPPPGTIIPLGRLDISWRSSMGEPGRLLTSVLSRRIPLPPPPPSGVAPASALPPYLQKGALPGSPARPHSPSLQQQQQRAGTPPPPQRPGSPLRRPTPGPPPRPQSPSIGSNPVPPLPDASRADVEVDLVVVEGPASSVRVEEPFALRFSLGVSAVLPQVFPGPHGDVRKRTRVMKLAVQHVLPIPPRSESSYNPKLANTAPSLDHTAVMSPRSSSIDAFTPRQLMSPPGTGTPGGPHRGISSPEKLMSPTETRSVTGLGLGGLAERLTRVAIGNALGDDTGTNANDEDEFGLEGGEGGIRLPPPYSTSLPVDPEGSGAGRVSFVGSSISFLPAVSMSSSDGRTNDVDLAATITHNSALDRGEETIEFSLTYIPLSPGFARVGGLRVLLVEDQETLREEDAASVEDQVTLNVHDSDITSSEARILKEWPVVAEIWVR